MNSNCDRCGQEPEGAYFIFYEVDQRDRKHRFGIFCIKCAIELLDELEGNIEWFHIESGWKGYIHPEARAELEKIGFIRPRHNSQYIEIKQVKLKRGEVERSDALAILRVKYAAGLVSKEEYEKLLKELECTSL